MAIFNPEVAVSDVPNFTNITKPISGVEANKSLGIGLSTLGDALSGIVNIADTAVKDTIKKDVYAKVDQTRDSYTNTLEQLRNAQQGSVVPAAVQTGSGTTAGQSLTGGPPTAPVPAAIDVGLNKVDAVQAALAAGKVNDTYYTQRLNSIAKDLRTQYPGYREYIDQRISEATGINPANAYVKNLMEDINRSAITKDKEFDHTEASLRSLNDSGAPNSDIMLKAFRNKIITQDQAEEYINKTNATMYRIKTQDAIRANNKGTKEEIASQRTADFTNEVGASIDNNFHIQTTIAGTNTPQGILDFVGKVANGKAQATDAQFEQLATLILAQKNLSMAQTKTRSNQLVNGVSYASDIGVTKADEINKSQHGIYDLVYDALKNKDAGAAYYHMNQARAILDDTKANILTGDMGGYVAKSKTFLDTMGPNWNSMVINEGLRKDMDQKARALYNDNTMDARLQPNLATTGVPSVLKDHIEAAKAKNVKDPKFYDSLIDVVNDIRNPKAPDADKANVLRYLYDPKNQRLLTNFKTDYINPNTGKKVPGKYAAWSRLTSPDITEAVAKIAKSDPAAGAMYKNWVENEFGSQLFYKEIQNLNKFKGHDDIHFAWDSDAKDPDKRLTIIDNKGMLAPPSGPAPISGAGGTIMLQDKGYMYQVQQIVDRINGGLRNLSQVEKSFGGDENVYLLSVLQHAQLDMEHNFSGLPKNLAEAIANSKKSTAKRMEDTFGNLGNN